MPFLHPSDVIDYTCEIPHGDGARASTLAIATVCVTAFVSALDVTIVNLALPSIAADFMAGIGELQWVVDAYNITLAGCLLLAAGLGDRFTHRRVFLLGGFVFLLGTTAAALAPTITVLITGRVVMGLGAAMLLTPALALLGLMCTGQERGRALGLWAVMSALGFALGPVVGGLLLNVSSWRSVFLITLPVLVALLIIGPRVLPRAQMKTSAHVDIPGAVLSVVSLVLVLGALIEAPERGWLSPIVLLSLLAGVVVGVMFVRWELRTATPMVDLTLLAQPVLSATMAAFFALYFASNAILFVAPQQLMIVSGFSSVTAGLLLLPLSIVIGVFGFKAAAIARSRTPRGALSLGMALIAAGFVFLALSVTGPGSMWTATGVLLGTMVAGMGFGIVTPVGNAIVLDAAGEDHAGSGSGLGAMFRFIGASAGVAIAGSLLAAVYSGSIVRSFTDAGVPAPVNSGPQATEVAISMLPAPLHDVLEPLAVVALENATQWTYVMAGLVVVVCLVFFRVRTRAVRDEMTRA